MPRRSEEEPPVELGPRSMVGRDSTDPEGTDSAPTREIRIDTTDPEGTRSAGPPIAS